MQSRAQIAGHPLHPIFVTVPIGLWSFVPVCDIIYYFGWGGDSWKTTAFYCIAGGIAGAVPAIITGLIDWPLARSPKAKATALLHIILNSFVTVAFTLSLYLRFREFHPSNVPGELPIFGLTPAIITLLGAGALGVSGWLGGELVSRFGISVHRDAIAADDAADLP